ncbi:MAG: beta-ketoacyl-ACP reductase [Pelagibacterales bacterium]|nr:beta-ketoacyl-ACP reductase [Pelagibacterales bacterium]PPR15670.1 MAG: 3-oxoacyl-[acyl-carrier-protein] reductase FabG [Alphaproteobacteria bacterium MarineAlpha9_Bin3]|tara:strand:- start:7190 stop:7948 length:759 start_codon:yes stop_codon:yes gene_type:complete
MNTREFKGKVALITGASRGIGRAIAIELARNGAAISINYNSDIKAAKETQKLVNEVGVKSTIIKANISKEMEVKKLIKNTEKKLGSIDLLVTNAGIALLSKKPLELNYRVWKETMATNVDGTLLPIKEVLPGMIKRKFGRIVCISSVAGLGMRPNMITYGTSKAAVIALVRNLSSAVAPYIRINSVAPGLIETDMIESLDKKARKNIIENTPLQRIGETQDIANTVCYLLSEKSDFTTGQTLVTDGGRVPLP